LRQNHYEATGQSGDDVYGVTKFADLTYEEFRGQFMGYEQSGHRHSMPVSVPGAIELPNKVDWRTKHVVSPVKNQGQCGSCWAFSAVEEVESAWAFQGNALKLLSVQQVVSCDKVDLGCDGGDTPTAYDYIKKAGGLDPQSEYPYSSGDGSTGQCKVKSGDEIVTVDSYSYATPPCEDSCNHQNETHLAASLATYGPVSICVNANNAWQMYTGGVLSNGCPHGYYDLDHCVQLVGYNQEGDNNYYIVRNSWATDWGIDGYIYIKMGENLCGVADEATLVKATQA